MLPPQSHLYGLEMDSTELYSAEPGLLYEGPNCVPVLCPVPRVRQTLGK